MIKIIERGTKQIRTCENCGCKFSFEAEDIEERKVNVFFNNSVVLDKVVFCPQCSEAVVLERQRWNEKKDICYNILKVY